MGNTLPAPVYTTQMIPSFGKIHQRSRLRRFFRVDSFIYITSAYTKSVFFAFILSRSARFGYSQYV